MDSGVWKVVVACADTMTMVLTTVVLWLICSPFEVGGSLMKAVRAMRRVISGPPGYQRDETCAPRAH